MALERLSQVTDSGISTGIVFSNASVTGVLTATSEFNVGSGLTITSTSNTTTVTSDNVNITGNSTVSGNSLVDGKLGVGTDNVSSNTISFGTNPRGYTSYALIHNPSGVGATTRAELSDNAALIIQPHATNSTHMAFGQVNTGAGMGIQVTDYAKTADWDICLNPFGGDVSIGNTNPQSKLDVSGEIRASGIAITESYPTIRPSLNLDFANSRSLDSRITFERASSATYVGRNGIITSAASGEPRFDHHPTTGECLGLLIEDSRTNLTNDDWRQSGADRFSLTLNDTGTLAPDGSTDAAKVFITGSEGNPAGSIYFFASLTSFTSSSIHTGSVFVKPILENVFRITAHSNYASETDGGSAQTVNFDYNLSTQTVTLNTGAIAGSITPYQNGWYRLSFTYYRNSSNSNSNYAVILYPQTYTTVNNSPGSGTRDICWVWGAQTEVGDFVSSYIDSGTSTATRAKDDAIISGESFESWINKNEGTWFIEYKLVGALTALMSISGTGGSVNERYMMWNLGVADSISNAVVDGGVVQANISQSITSSLTQFTKAIFAGKDNDFALSANGQTPVTDTSGTIYNSPTQLRFAYGSGSSTPYAYFKSCVYYPKRLTNAQLIALTS